MARKFLFLPVPASDLISMANEWQEERVNAWKPFEQVLVVPDRGLVKSRRRSTGGGLLRKLIATDHLYVLCHGAHTRRETGASSLGSYAADKLYDPVQFAEMLIAEGLKKDLIHLTLWACKAGASPDGIKESFAERLKQALYHRKFYALTVTAYTVDLTGHHDTLARGTTIPDPPTERMNLGRNGRLGAFVAARDFKEYF